MISEPAFRTISRATGVLPSMHALALLGGCGSSSPKATTSTHTATTRAPTSEPGLGSTLTSFNAAHTGTHESLSEEILYTLVTTNKAGRVIFYQVTYPTAMTDVERINLLGGTALPSGAIVTDESPICKLWRSIELRRRIGFEYARVTTVPGTTSAQIRATSFPGC